jgi:Rad3-related DNA helicase
MSAYPGDKHIFCRSLGLNPDEVAWIKLKSPFDPANRPIVLGCVGSMSKRNKAQTLPSVLRSVDKILTAHNNEKGIIHCNSYALGEEIYNHFSGTVHGLRLLFPKSADERDGAVSRHKLDTSPTVLLSPSMTEGFDFKDDTARWQIVAKMPYPYLGDMQVSAMKDRDPDWYAMQTAMTIIQACGRIVRDEADHGVTYVLDADFNMLWERHSHFFPPWFKAAMVWPGKK